MISRRLLGAVLVARCLDVRLGGFRLLLFGLDRLGRFIGSTLQAVDSVTEFAKGGIDAGRSL